MTGPSTTGAVAAADPRHVSAAPDSAGGAHSKWPVLISREGHVGIITLNRPHRLNAVSRALYEALLDVIDTFAGDEDVRALVLTGSGRAFCAGADLKAHASSELSRKARSAYIKLAQRANRALRRSPKPVIAAVNGAAVGAGLELALSCDFMIVASDAKLRLPEVAIGTFVGGGVTRELPRRVGITRARELLLLGDFFSGDDAAAMALAYRAVPAEQVLPCALELAGRLANAAPVPLRRMRRLLERADRMSLKQVMREEAEALEACMGTYDWREGVRAFTEKRPPRFRGS